MLESHTRQGTMLNRSNLVLVSVFQIPDNSAPTTYKYITSHGDRHGHMQEFIRLIASLPVRRVSSTHISGLATRQVRPPHRHRARTHKRNATQPKVLRAWSAASNIGLSTEETENATKAKNRKGATEARNAAR